MITKQHKTNIENLSENPLNSPIVYILKNKNELYVGETTNLVNRFKAHHKVMSGEFSSVDEIRTFANNEYNLSITKDIENQLIVAAKTTINKVKISNANNGFSKHRYPAKQEEIAKQDAKKIWNDLFVDEWKLTSRSLDELKNRDILKLSPYHQLNHEQEMIKNEILNIVEKSLVSNQKTLINVYGDAGTGKSVLLSCLFNEINLMTKKKNTNSNLYENKEAVFLCNHMELRKNYVNLAKEKNITWTAKQFPKTITSFLKNNGDNYISIVDEAHTLFFRPVTYGKGYRGNNQLNDIAQKSLITIAVYDPKQVVQYNSWVSSADNIENIENTKSYMFNLETQMRIQATSDVSSWIQNLVYNKELAKIPENNDFEINIFKDPVDLYNNIKAKNSINKKSRMTATYDYKWRPTNGPWYVEEGNFKLPWNRHHSADKETWTEIKDTINEIGSVYSVQGFDLDYVGVIIGPSVTLNLSTNRISYNFEKWQDNTAKKIGHINNSSHNIPKEVQEQLIQNALNVLLTRGVKGIYIYFSDVIE